MCSVGLPARSSLKTHTHRSWQLEKIINPAQRVRVYLGFRTRDDGWSETRLLCVIADGVTIIFHQSIAALKKKYFYPGGHTGCRPVSRRIDGKSTYNSHNFAGRSNVSNRLLLERQFFQCRSWSPPCNHLYGVIVSQCRICPPEYTWSFQVVYRYYTTLKDLNTRATQHRLLLSPPAV
jgi:hypothetical protein